MHLAETRERIRRSVGPATITLIVLVVAIMIFGEITAWSLQRLGQVFAHHSLHVLFSGGAVVVFVIYALLDVRRRGRPSFSWRLRAAPESKSAREPGPANGG